MVPRGSHEGCGDIRPSSLASDGIEQRGATVGRWPARKEGVEAGRGTRKEAAGSDAAGRGLGRMLQEDPGVRWNPGRVVVRQRGEGGGSAAGDGVRWFGGAGERWRGGAGRWRAGRWTSRVVAEHGERERSGLTRG